MNDHLAIERFPRASARTQRFTLGRPRTFTVAPDGARVVFLRSTHGEDRVNRLWVLDVATGAERVVADPTALDDAGDLPDEERRRRERLREAAGGITTYSTDRDVTAAVFALSGRLYVTDLDAGTTRAFAAEPAAFDPRLDPAGRLVAYVAGGRLHVSDGDTTWEIVREDAPDVTWGEAEFVAAEEMGRTRGHWWDGDGDRLAVCRVDVGPVDRWHLADPIAPARPPVDVAYPAAGTANAEVTLWVVDARGGGERVEVAWDRGAFPYLARVRWGRGPLGLLVQSRDQRTVRTLVADPDDGTTTVVREDTDPRWVDLVDGTPAWLQDGRLVTTIEDGDVRRLAVDGIPISAPDVDLDRIVGTGADAILVTVSRDAVERHVWHVPADGTDARPLTDGCGVHHAAGPSTDGSTVVVSSSTLDRTGASYRVLRDGETVAEVASHAADPGFVPEVRLLELGGRRLRGALVLPPGDGPAPVLLDPYGGPGAQRVVAAADAYLTPAWFAAQGFAVLVIDGRGTPGRGGGWARSVHLDLAGPVLDDQVDGLAAAGADEPRLDLGRVAIRGWSFGGYLAALAVLRRPDVFHAAVAGAPVTDWRLYDTHYTERYLGHPDEQPDAYERSSLLTDAARLERPLLLIHGLADDNVVAAHSLELSRALLEAGRPHTFLPLSGVTHMTPQEVVAENLLRLQLDFLGRALEQQTTSRRRR